MRVEEVKGRRRRERKLGAVAIRMRGRTMVDRRMRGFRIFVWGSFCYCSSWKERFKETNVLLRVVERVYMLVVVLSLAIMSSF